MGNNIFWIKYWPFTNLTSCCTSSGKTSKGFQCERWYSSCWLTHKQSAREWMSVYWRQIEENKFWLTGLMLFKIFKASLFKVMQKSILDFYLAMPCLSVLVLKLEKQITSYVFALKAVDIQGVVITAVQPLLLRKLTVPKGSLNIYCYLCTDASVI